MSRGEVRANRSIALNISKSLPGELTMFNHPAHAKTSPRLSCVPHACECVSRKVNRMGAATRKVLLRLTTLGLWAIGSGAGTDASERRWNAQTLVAEGVTTDVRLTADGSAIELDRGELIEDDGPAAGYSYKPNDEELSETVWARKQLALTDPRADEATLLVGARGKIQVFVNGTGRDLTRIGDAGRYWQAFALSPDTLQRGLNEVVIRGSGAIWIARDDEYAAGSRTRTRHPNRSAKSIDGGRTWDDQRLGRKGDADGEYYVRMFLERYRRQGTVLLPLFDVGNLDGRAVAPPLASVGPIRVRLNGDRGQQGSIAVRLRTAKTPVPSAKDWSEWQELGAAGVLERPAGRFVQLALELSTDDPLKSPRVREIEVETKSETSANWPASVKVLEHQNEKIVRTSVPFEYEPFDHPRLKALREQYRLDEVTADAKGEFELITRLAGWSATRWKGLGHLAKGYPPWDALEILKDHSDGTPVGGFCQQYNVVFLQACASYGLVGRAVSLGPGTLTDAIRSGHEVIEIWSNDFRKWIYVDGNYGWHFVDAKSGDPLSLMELRDRQIAAVRQTSKGSARLVRIVDTGQEWGGLTGFPPFTELRLIPRNNFLESRSPLPLNQGMRGWFWTGHFVWTDEELPAALLYGNRVSNRRNWAWTLNQAQCLLEATETEGELRVHLDTETPHFEAFLARIDHGQKTPVQSGFIWKLQPGKNRLEVQPRNAAHREGITSQIVLEYSP